LVHHAANVIHEGTDKDIANIMSGKKKVKPVSEAITKASNFELLLVDPKEEQALESAMRCIICSFL